MPKFTVKKIVAHRLVHAGFCSRHKYDSIELQIQWGGFSDRSNTWEQLHEVYGDIGHLARYYFRLRNLELICKCEKIRVLVYDSFR